MSLPIPATVALPIAGGLVDAVAVPATNLIAVAVPIVTAQWIKRANLIYAAILATGVAALVTWGWRIVTP